MQNFEIKISKNEIEIIFMALRDLQERLDEQLSAIHSAYWELTAKEKLFWRNKSAYDEYKNNFTKICYKQSEDAYNLEEKLKSILEQERK